MFPNSHLFLLKPAKALEEGVFRDIPASQIPLFKGIHWDTFVPLGHSPVSPAHNHYQVCWSNSLSSSGHPTASVYGESGWCQEQMISHLALVVWPEPSAQVPPPGGGMWWVPPGNVSGAPVAALGMEELPPSTASTSPPPAADRTQVSSQGLTEMCKKGREMIDSQLIQTQIHWNKTLFMPLKGDKEQKRGDEESEAHAYNFPINCRFWFGLSHSWVQGHSLLWVFHPGGVDSSLYTHTDAHTLHLASLADQHLSAFSLFCPSSRPGF